MAWFAPRVVAPPAVRLCVLGNGVALQATALPWQSWSGGLVWVEHGPPLLVTLGGALLAGLATAIALSSALPRTDARGLLRRARRRACLAVLAAALWVGPLPFGPELPHDRRQRIDWTVAYQAGAVGAVLAAIGAVWWTNALADAALDRGLRRALQRGARPRRTTVVVSDGPPAAPSARRARC
jgi:hypothetical protein